jgi:hypothetical protein
VELGRGHVHADLDLAGVAGLLDGVAAKSNGFLHRGKGINVTKVFFPKGDQ